MSQPMNTLPARAARAGDPTANMPKTMSNTPHNIDHVEACRRMWDTVCCAIETSSKDGQSVLSAVAFCEQVSTLELRPIVFMTAARFPVRMRTPSAVVMPNCGLQVAEAHK